MSLVITRIASCMKAKLAPDEDALTLMLEAAHGVAYEGERLALASTSLPYTRRVQAGLLVEALGLPPHTFCLECTTSARAATEAIRALGPGLVLAADGNYAAGAVLRAGPGGIASVLATQGAVAEAPGLEFTLRGEADLRDIAVQDYAEAVYVDVVRAAAHGLSADFLALNPPNGRFARGLGLLGEVVLAPEGSGAAGPLLALEEALRRATPGRRILLVGYGSGSAADAILLEKTFG